jgi:hypothetical protein
MTANGQVRPHPDVVERYVCTTIRGSWCLQTYKQLGIRAIEKYSDKHDAEHLNETYDYNKPYFRKTGFPSPEGLQQNLKIAEENTLEAKDAKPAQFVDTSIVEKIKASGFIKNLWGTDNP